MSTACMPLLTSAISVTGYISVPSGSLRVTDFAIVYSYLYPIILSIYISEVPPPAIVMPEGLISTCAVSVVFVIVVVLVISYVAPRQ